jgi:hypothetical protein
MMLVWVLKTGPKEEKNAKEVSDSLEKMTELTDYIII